MRYDEADEAPVRWIDRSHNVSSNMTAVVSLGWSGASLDPAMSRSGITFKASFIAKEDLGLRILQKPQELRCKLGSLLLPNLLVGRFGNRTRYPAGVIMLMKVAQKCSVADLQISLLFEPTAQTYRGPVVPIGNAWIINNREDFLADFIGRQRSWSARARPVCQAVDARLVEATDPELKASFRGAGRLPCQLESAAAQHQQNRVETLLRLLIRAAVDGPAQFLQGTVFRIGKLTCSADPKD